MWQKQSKNNPGLTEKGFATFALTLTNIPAKTPLILRINSLMGAYTIFIDGSLVLKNGVAGATDEMQIQGKIGTKLIHLPFQSGIKPVTRIVVQVSKFFQVAGGAQFSFELGTTDKIETKWEHERMLLAFSAAML